MNKRKEIHERRQDKNQTYNVTELKAAVEDVKKDIDRELQRNKLYEAVSDVVACTGKECLDKEVRKQAARLKKLLDNGV